MGKVGLKSGQCVSSVHGINMKKSCDVKGSIGVQLDVKVSRRGAGASLYVRKEFCEWYGIKPGDKLKIEILEHWRPKPAGGDKNAET